MEHIKNGFAPVAEWDSATGTLSTIATGEPFASVEPVVFDRHREDGWTPERQIQFLEELADCGIIQEAAARVGMSRKSAWQLRRRAIGTAFATAWEAALKAGMQQVHSIAFERAVEGVVKHVYYRGEVVGEQRLYDTRLLLALLAKAGQPFNRDLAWDAERNWQAHLDAIGQGLTRVGPSLLTDTGQHLWADETGTCWTDLPPPPDAAVPQQGEPGDKGYCRQLTDEERAVVEAHDGRLAAEAEAERAHFFSLEKRF